MDEERMNKMIADSIECVFPEIEFKNDNCILTVLTKLY
jgi:hypothetical protein